MAAKRAAMGKGFAAAAVRAEARAEAGAVAEHGVPGTANAESGPLFTEKGYRAILYWNTLTMCVNVRKVRAWK